MKEWAVCKYEPVGPPVEVASNEIVSITVR